jgi:arabinose-5-phosphate isomerase
VILVSHSGETEEIVLFAKALKNNKKYFISLTGNPSSKLSKISDFNFSYESGSEFSFNGLSPTSSSTSLLVIGDILSVCLEKARGFSVKDFSKIHPSGSIGKSNLTEVSKIMIPVEKLPILTSELTLHDALSEISNFGLGMLFVTDKQKNLIGIISDGDIRRFLLVNDTNRNSKIEQIINRNPKFVFDYESVLDANLKMASKDRFLNLLPVLNKDKKLVGALTLKNIVENGIKLIKLND